MRLYLISLRGLDIFGKAFERVKTIRLDSPAKALAYAHEAAVDRNMQVIGVKDVTNIQDWILYSNRGNHG